MRNALLLALVTLFSVNAVYADSASLSTDKEKYSYTIGVQIAQSLNRDGMDLDQSALALAIADVLTGHEMRLSVEDMKGAIEKVRMIKLQERNSAAGKNKEEGTAYLLKNTKLADVTTLKSGLQYKVINEGSGKKPKLTDQVEVHYHGMLIDGTVFDSSVDRGQSVSFPVNGVIPGWVEALQMMKEGAKWQLTIPAELAYGERGAGPVIGPNAVLLFDVELIAIK